MRTYFGIIEDIILFSHLTIDPCERSKFAMNNLMIEFMQERIELAYENSSESISKGHSHSTLADYQCKVVCQSCERT